MRKRNCISERITCHGLNLCCVSLRCVSHRHKNQNCCLWRKSRSQCVMNCDWCCERKNGLLEYQKNGVRFLCLQNAGWNGWHCGWWMQSQNGL